MDCEESRRRHAVEAPQPDHWPSAPRIATSPQLGISLGQCSEQGIKPDNQDFYGCEIPPPSQRLHKGVVAAIADGMSGCEAGKQASQAAVIGFLSDYLSAPDSWSVKHAGQKVLSATNSWLYSQGYSRFGSPQGMVTTLSILVLKSNTGHIFHIGDSRIYRLRGGNLEQLTRDHRIPVDGSTGYLSRAMGIEPHLEVDYRSFPLEAGDIFLMTTDGVHDFVDARTLCRHLSDRRDDLREAAEAIVAEAVTRSHDNLTCQILRIDSLPPGREDEILRQYADLPFPPPLESGMRLDGFRIEEELHASKRTQIYRAVDIATGDTVVIKTPSVNFEDDPLYIEHFLQEEWAGKRIRHQNVVKVLAGNRTKSCLYYVTEYLKGPTLRQWMELYPRPEITSVREIVEQIAKGLRSLHRLHMLHQDLKPENLMFDRSGRLKIIDFGSVKIAGIAEIAAFGTSETIRGTLNYTAPEYLLGQPGTPRSDLFSLGVITYELLTGALPYGKDLPEKADKAKLARLEYVSAMHHNPMVPLWMDRAVEKAVAINPARRHADLYEFIHELSHPNRQFLSQQRPPLIQRNPIRFWKAACALLALANLILIYLLAN